MTNKRDYLDRLQIAVQELHKCGAVCRETVPAHEAFREKTIWRGHVEVADLTGHPKAKRAYAWSHWEGPQDQGERFVAVLELSPVKDARSAVQVSIAADIKDKK